MTESKRLLALYVDGRLVGRELEKLKARLESDPAFARRAGMYSEDDLLLRDAIASLRLTDGLADRVCQDLPEREPAGAAAQLGPGMTLMLFVAAALMVVGTVLFQGTARAFEMIGVGAAGQAVAHVSGVAIGFMLLVWSGRRAGFHSSIIDSVAQIIQRPGGKMIAHGLAILLCLGAGMAALFQVFPLQNLDVLKGPLAADMAVILGIPVLVALLVKAGDFMIEGNPARSDLLRVRVANSLGLVLLVGACAAHYVVVAG